MALVFLPSAFFVRAFRDYFGFLGGWSEGGFRPSKIIRLPPAARRGTRPAPEVRFVRFALKKPRAKTVRLAADFNGWDSRSLPLKKNGSGVWETSLPLPRGKYRYSFEADGEPIGDPENKISELRNGATVAVLNVE